MVSETEPQRFLSFSLGGRRHFFCTEVFYPLSCRQLCKFSRQALCKPYVCTAEGEERHSQDQTISVLMLGTKKKVSEGFQVQSIAFLSLDIDFSDEKAFRKWGALRWPHYQNLSKALDAAIAIVAAVVVMAIVAVVTIMTNMAIKADIAIKTVVAIRTVYQNRHGHYDWHGHWDLYGHWDRCGYENRQRYCNYCSYHNHRGHRDLCGHCDFVSLCHRVIVD